MYLKNNELSRRNEDEFKAKNIIIELRDRP